MSFKNQRNSRDDNSKNQRSNSESFKSKSGQGRKNSFSKSENFGKPSFSKDAKDDRKPFGKSSFSKDRSEEGKSFGRPSKFSKDGFKSSERSSAGKSFDRPSKFSKDGFKSNDRNEEGKSFNRSSKFSKDGYKSNERSEGGKPFGRASKFAKEGYKPNEKPVDREGRARRSTTATSEYQEQREKNDFKYTANRKFRPANKPANKTAEDDGLIRLNRYISNSGVCSRRKADELIAAGVVSVNGEVVTELGTKVDPAKDEIRYNNERLKREKMVYVLLNKPKDYITTTDDPQERRTVMQLVAKATKERIYPVGRLDRNTTGLLLLTNDGNLADKLSHPRNGVTKIYQVELNKNLTQGDFNKIEFGLELEDGFIKPDDVSYVQGASKNEVGIQIHSGKNRIVRRIFESLGYEVIKLDRVVYANLTKKDLPRGRWRYLEERELVQLKHLIK